MDDQEQETSQVTDDRDLEPGYNKDYGPIGVKGWAENKAAQKFLDEDKGEAPEIIEARQKIKAAEKKRVEELKEQLKNPTKSASDTPFRPLDLSYLRDPKKTGN